MLVQLDRPSHRAAIAVKMTRPVGMAQHDIRAAVRAMLIRGVKEAPKVRLNSQRVEIVPACLVNPCRNRTPSRVQPGARDLVRDQVVEAAISLPPKPLLSVAHA